MNLSLSRHHFQFLEAWCFWCLLKMKEGNSLLALLQKQIYEWELGGSVCPCPDKVYYSTRDPVKYYYLSTVLFIHRTLKAENKPKWKLSCCWSVSFSTHVRVLLCKVLYSLHPYFPALGKLQEDKTSQTWAPYTHTGWLNQMHETVHQRKSGLGVNMMYTECTHAVHKTSQLSLL